MSILLQQQNALSPGPMTAWVQDRSSGTTKQLFISKFVRAILGLWTGAISDIGEARRLCTDIAGKGRRGNKPDPTANMLCSQRGTAGPGNNYSIPSPLESRKRHEEAGLAQSLRKGNQVSIPLTHSTDL